MPKINDAIIKQCGQSRSGAEPFVWGSRTGLVRKIWQLQEACTYLLMNFKIPIGSVASGFVEQRQGLIFSEAF